jgi:hypothetical protein
MWRPKEAVLGHQVELGAPVVEPQPQHPLRQRLPPEVEQLEVEQLEVEQLEVEQLEVEQLEVVELAFPTRAGWRRYQLGTHVLLCGEVDWHLEPILLVWHV